VGPAGILPAETVRSDSGTPRLSPNIWQITLDKIVVLT